MQPQSESSRSKHRSQQQQPQPATTSATPKQQQQQQNEPRRSPCKVIKGKKPLCHFKFYLDIRDHQLTKKLEEQIKTLGGALDFFLTSSVTHFITDKTVQPPNVGNNNNNTLNSRPGTPQTPATPGTPQTPYSLESYDGNKNNGSCATPGATNTTTRKTRQSRADAILNRARRQSTTTNVTTVTATPTTHRSKVDSTQQPPYTIWQTEYALRFFKKVQHELKEYLHSGERKLNGKTYTVEPISLKGGFIKVEALKRNYRPYYQLFRKPSEWPKIELTRDDGAFRLSPKKNTIETAADLNLTNKTTTNMTRKSRSRSSQRQHAVPSAVQGLKKGDLAKNSSAAQRNSVAGVGGAAGNGCKQVKESSDKQCGVCEICKIEYDTLTIHLKTKDHEYFAKNSQNFIALDTLIHNSADVNKFLHEAHAHENKLELDEMEVEEDLIADVNVPDPLEDPEPHELSRRSGGPYNTPSPTLREKSKRTTKGKHSSEKFQQTTTPKPTSKSPKTPTPTKSASPVKKQCVTAATSSMLELQRIETQSVTTPFTRRKPVSAASAISPPIRPMLPPSSLYKVVETTELCTTPRKIKDLADNAAVASPSLIVKFKKVRQTQLHRLNGEAENFMFPKQRTSSELPTDIDRQTTSDNVRERISSASIDSSTSDHMDTDATSQQSTSKLVVGKKAIATAKRRKGRPAMLAKQSFPNAPIQPEIQLKRLRTTPLTAAAAIVAASASITLPEATRKSSRTATAIVTAATTSSRLLRAAVEAAKHNSRRLAATSSATAKPDKRRRCSLPTASTAQRSPTTKMRRRRRITVVNMEDRMGDDTATNTDESDNEEKDDAVNEPDNDEQDETTDIDSDEEQDEDDGDNDDDNDADYIAGYYKRRQLAAAVTATAKLVTSTREERAAKRKTLLAETTENEASASEAEPESKVKRQQQQSELKPSKHTPSKQQLKRQSSILSSTAPCKKSSSPQRYFDHAKSERLQQLRYAFERLPAADLWYRVFSRQDACEEAYFEYFGSTKYRKLPYELGPIPFERAPDNHSCCKLCQSKLPTAPSKTTSKKVVNNAVNIKQEPDTCETNSTKQEESSSAADASNTNELAATSPTQAALAASQHYALKHKKLHLLHRYRQEQQQLLLQKHQSSNMGFGEPELELKSFESQLLPSKCDSKASTPERIPDRVRAGSTHSTASSCASSSLSIGKKQQYRNKHLQKAPFLNLELPPRKSPREHASTLALVSCIIKQRQDSQSKPNSEIDEPTTPLTPTPVIVPPTTTPAPVAKEEVKPAPPTEITSVRSPRNTRSAAATPIEELRFATDICESVKRQRRGQNKYDHSPPIVPRKQRASRGRPPLQSASSPFNRRLLQLKQRNQTKTNITIPRRRGRQKQVINILGGSTGASAGQPSIRKTGSKKGVVEYEVDAAALKALDAATKHSNVRQLEWQIDKYISLANQKYDFDADVDVNAALVTNTIPVEIPATKLPEIPAVITTSSLNTSCSYTPPHSDYFSSDFDLCDLFTNSQAGASDEDQLEGGVAKRKGFSLYNSVALLNYFRKRKSLKSNRTGWPKVQKKKSSVRQQHMKHEKIKFMQEIGEVNDGDLAKLVPVNEEGNSTNEKTRDSGVITPPDSDMEDDAKTLVDEDGGDDDTELDAGEESIPEEDEEEDAETMVDSLAGEVTVEADADEEDAEVDEDDYEPAIKRTRQRSAVASPVEKLANTLLSTCSGGGTTTNNATSTPSAQMLRGLRRTPQLLLNGSLGSCISPSEKAGDTSDIFTVSSDGLDTDLDMSNSQLKGAGGCGADDEHNEHCPNHTSSSTTTATPKRKFDLAKYASNNAASSSCAAEAATAAAKSLAISQFLKKEVRVTCRRIRAPFRRFRYRR